MASKLSSTSAQLLPLWPAPVRATPSVTIRSRLFRAMSGGSLESIPALAPDDIACSDGTLIRYYGPVLSQAELDVWLALLDLASEHKTLTLEISLYQILRALDRPTAGQERYETLKGQLLKLVGAVPVIKRHDVVIAKSMLSMEYDKANEQFCIELAAEIVNLFAREGGGYSYIDWSERQALHKSPLAQWLHAFFSSHTAATYTLEDLRELSGSRLKSKSKFKEAIKSAAMLMRNRLRWKVLLLEGSRDRLHVNRTVIVQPVADTPKAPLAVVPLTPAPAASAPAAPVAPTPAAAAPLATWAELTHDGLDAFCTRTLSEIEALATAEELRRAKAWALYGVPRGNVECFDVKAHLIALMRSNRDPDFDDARWHPLQAAAPV